MILTVEDLENYLKRSLSEEGKRQASIVLAGVQAELERRLGNRLEIVEIAAEEHVLDSSVGLRLYLDATPVLEVAALSVDGNAVDAATYTRRRWGLERSIGWGYWPTALVPEPVASVDYTAGIDATADDHVRIALLRAAASEMTRLGDDASGLQRLSIEGYDATYAELFPETELKALGRLKKRSVG